MLPAEERDSQSKKKIKDAVNELLKYLRRYRFLQQIICAPECGKVIKVIKDDPTENGIVQAYILHVHIYQQLLIRFNTA